MRCDTVGFLWQSRIPSQGLPARVSGVAVFWRWGPPVGSAKEFSLRPLSPVIVPCVTSGLRMSPEVTGADSKGEQPNVGQGPRCQGG